MLQKKVTWISRIKNDAILLRVDICNFEINWGDENPESTVSRCKAKAEFLLRVSLCLEGQVRRETDDRI